MPLRCVGLGEILWDILPSGRQAGGAPANFAYHCAALGAHADVVSRVGGDEPGRAFLAHLQALGLGTAAVEIDPAAPTGKATVAVGADGQPKFTIHENVAWDRLAGEAAALRVLAVADVVGFGTLVQRTPAARAAVGRLLDATRPDALRVFDVNLRQHYHSPAVIAESLARARVLKVSDTELPVLAAQFGLNGDDRTQLQQLLARYPLRAIALTRGERGSLVYTDGAWHEQPAVPVRVADTVGAGDSFTASFTLGLLQGWPLPVIAARAAAVSAYVCSRPGATPPLPAELTAPYRTG